MVVVSSELGSGEELKTTNLTTSTPSTPPPPPPQQQPSQFENKLTNNTIITSNSCNKQEEQEQEIIILTKMDQDQQSNINSSNNNNNNSKLVASTLSSSSSTAAVVNDHQSSFVATSDSSSGGGNVKFEEAMSDLNIQYSSGDLYFASQFKQILIKLYSKDYDRTLDAVCQIKNLTIGNNNYKTFFLNDKILEKLIEILNNVAFELKATSNNNISNSNSNNNNRNLNNSYLNSGGIEQHRSAEKQFELINQILITLGSFSLGTLTHVFKLVKKFKLHVFLFNLLLNLSQHTAGNGSGSSLLSITNIQNLTLIESCLRCLSNLYSTAQLVSSLVYLIDSVLYSHASSSSSQIVSLSSVSSSGVSNENQAAPYLNALLNVFSLSNHTKQTVINIASISSSNFLTACINTSPTSLLIKSSLSKSKINRRLNNDIECFNHSRNLIKSFRNALMNSGSISRFAVLLTDMQPIVQLNALKFYSSICFENYEATISILNTSFCEMPLIDLIGLYLSGDNSLELQLYAAKCLTNLCRSIACLAPPPSPPPQPPSSLSSNVNYNKNSSAASNSSICLGGGCDSMETSTHEGTTTTTDQQATTNRVASLSSSSVTAAINNDTVTPKQQQMIIASSSLSSSNTALASSDQMVAVKQLVDYASPLIKLRTLSTLIHLCYTCSNNYRNFKNGNINLTNVTTLLTSSGASTSAGSYLASKLNKLTNSVIQVVNMLMLIQSLSTLTYLIELNSDLQEKASNLEQIIGSIFYNIEEAYQSLNSSNLAAASSLSSLDISSNKSLSYFRSGGNNAKQQTRARRGRRLKQSAAAAKKSGTHAQKNQRQKAQRKQAASWSSVINPFLISSTSAFVDHHHHHHHLSQQQQHPVQQSIFSSFYVKYNQFAAKGIHIKLNEHQYKMAYLQDFQAKVSKNFDVGVERNLSSKAKRSSRSSYRHQQDKRLNRPIEFLNNLNKSVNKCLIAVSFHAFSAFASNNEEARRQISDQVGILSHILDSIQIKAVATKSAAEIAAESVEKKPIERLDEDREEETGKATADNVGDDSDDECEEEQDFDENDDDEEDYSSDSSGGAGSGGVDLEMNTSESSTSAMDESSSKDDKLTLETTTGGSGDFLVQDFADYFSFEYFDELEDIEDSRYKMEIKRLETTSNYHRKQNELPIYHDHSCILRFSALCLLHSLSRSVHQLRTKFLDINVWKSLIELIQRAKNQSNSVLDKNRTNHLLQQLQSQLNKVNNKSSVLSISQKNNNKLGESHDDDEIETEEMNYSTSQYGTANYSGCETSNKFSDSNNENDDEDEKNKSSRQSLCLVDENEQNLLCVLTAIFANLLLEFSPSKETMFENGIIKVLVELVDHKNMSVKKNCLWALMNMAYKAEQRVKQQILSTITMEKLFQLLTEQDETLIMKTLNLLRNLICHRPHIDLIMTLYGTKIIQAIIMILESDYYNQRIKEQALCILVNVADGSVSKDFIIGNEDLLRKINSFMTHNCSQLQVSAVCCISNLLSNIDDGANERQAKLKEMGVQRILNKLMHSNDAFLIEKVKFALSQFTPLASLNSFGGSISNNNQSTSSSSSTTSINSSTAT